MGKIYLKELAPWEQKSKHFRNVRFGYLENIQQNVETALESIRIQTESWINSANHNYISSDIASDVLDLLTVDETRMAYGLIKLGPVFEWGISDVIWRFEQNSQYFKQVFAEISIQYKDQNIKRLNQKAELGYQKGWFDEALKDFLKVEKRGGADFSVYISIGMIYLFHMINKNKALEYFEKAETAIKSKSNFYASYALMYQALIKRDMGLIEEAELLSKKAASISSTYAEVLYQNAQYNMMLGRTDNAIAMIKKTLSVDISYGLKIINEKDFKSLMPHINELFEDIIRVKKEEAILGYEKFKDVINEILDIQKRFNDTFRSKQFEFEPEIMRIIQNGFDEMDASLHRGSVMDLVLMDRLMKDSDFSRMTWHLYQKAHQHVMMKRKEFREPFEKKIQQVRNRCNMFTTDGNNRMGQLLVTLGYLLFGILGTISATSIKMSMPYGIIGAVVGFMIALTIQFIIKRYGETYDIDYTVYDTYNQTELFLKHLNKLKKQLSVLKTATPTF